MTNIPDSGRLPDNPRTAMKIRAALLEAHDRPLTIQTVDLHPPRPDEVLVRIIAVGVCHTDLSWPGVVEPADLPMVLGHEGVGVVEEIGVDVTTLAAGDRVVISYSSCGTCRNCRRLLPQYCEIKPQLNFAGQRLDGSTALSRGGRPVGSHFFGQSSFAEAVVTPARNCVVVPDHVDPTVLGPMGCGVQTGAGAVLNTLAGRPIESLAVFGVGSVGLTAIMAARVVGIPNVLAIDTDADRLKLATEFGATHVADATRVDPVDWIGTLQVGGVDAVIETVGSQSVITQALRVLHPPGVCITLGGQGMVNMVEVDQMALLQGRRLQGVLQGDSDIHSFIPHLISLHERGELPIDRLVTPFPFHRINDAMTAAANHDAVKPVLVMDW